MQVFIEVQLWYFDEEKLRVSFSGFSYISKIVLEKPKRANILTQ